MKRICLMMVAVVFAASVDLQPAQALPPFKKQFLKKYVGDDASEDTKAAFKKASCNACHIKGEEKEVNNAYAMELGKLIEGN